MFRLIKSMLYRMTHDLFFYLAAGICVFLSLISFGVMGYMENHVTSNYDESVTVSFEDEDPLNVSKHLILDNNVYKNVPGHDILYRDSLDNLKATTNSTISVSVVVLFVDILYLVLFFGEMFTKGAIRNMITAGSSKTKIYISSILMNVFFLIIFSAIAFISCGFFSLIRDRHPIIYIPAFATLLLAELLVGTVLSSLAILIIFITQRPLKAVLIMIGCVIALSVLSSFIDVNEAFDTKYEHDNLAFSREIAKLDDFEWYIQVSDFQLFTIRKADGTIYKDYRTENLNEYYIGDTKATILRTIWRLSITNLPLETSVFYIYPMYRDGVFTRYIVVSSVYLAVIAAAGCAVVKKRNIN